MRRYLSGLGQASATSAESLPDGLFLVRVERVQYRWHALKPYYGLVFMVLEPKLLSGNRLSGRLYCNSKALWKLNWFLRDFGYDSELLGRDEIDDNHLIGFSCSIASAKRIESAFANPGVTCRSSSRGRSQAAMTSSPMSMPSDSSMIAAAFSNGRRPLAATRKNLRGSWLLIRS